MRRIAPSYMWAPSGTKRAAPVAGRPSDATTSTAPTSPRAMRAGITIGEVNGTSDAIFTNAESGSSIAGKMSS
jgi:hypothetical protein